MARRPLVVNALLVATILIAFPAWMKIGKEEMPSFTRNVLRVVVPYPGASAEDVELFVTKPVEEKLKGVAGLYEIAATSTYGSATLSVSVDAGYGDLRGKFDDIKTAVESADLPQEADDPIYASFNSAEKAIIDIGLYLSGVHALGVDDRLVLQAIAIEFKNGLLTLPEISGVEWDGYRRPELLIHLRPGDLRKRNLSFTQVADEIAAQHLRRPAGSLADRGESDVVTLAELDTIEKLRVVPLRSGFEGQVVRLADVADVSRGFARSSRFSKVQGREGIVLNIQKSASTDILTAQKATIAFVDRYVAAHPDSPARLVVMDDESYDIRNRLALIGGNGAFGFILIVAILFLFLDFRSGVWVALGIPFSLAFTLIAAYAIGYTVNNMTLAAIIVVLGVVVDDAIIVAEHVMRHRRGDTERIEVEESVARVMRPILASVLTTVAAFLPLYFFEGRYAVLTLPIPVIVALMLGASLLESAFILPSHLRGDRRPPTPGASSSFDAMRTGATRSAERLYRATVRFALSHRGLLLMVFLAALASAVWLETGAMKFVMFPREETREIRVTAIGPADLTREEMAERMRKVEAVFLDDDTGVVLAFRTNVGQGRRGGEVWAAEARMRVELTPPAERNIPLSRLLPRWRAKLEALEGFESIKIGRSRFGSDTGSSVELQVRSNNDDARSGAAEAVRRALEKFDGLANVEVERPLTRREYPLNVDRDKTARLGVRFQELAATVRGFLEGRILYTLRHGEEEIDVRITSAESEKGTIDDLMAMTVANRDGYLTPIRQLVDVGEGRKPTNLQRINFKRTTNLYADIASDAALTPLDVAALLERDVFPDLTRAYAGVDFVFRGEIEDSRRSGSDFVLSTLLALGLIYLIMVLLFDSLLIPLVIAAVIPFGVVGVIYAFWGHGMVHYGFFAVIGVLGMLGVIVNDAIVMVSRFEAERRAVGAPLDRDRIAELAATRLRPIVLTTATTVAGLFPTAYGLFGYDSMLAEMMLALGWGLLFGMAITLFLTPCLYSLARPVATGEGRGV
jgi:multidrug efflux pump subunit AcrB